MLCLGDDASFESKVALVNDVISELGLNQVNNTLIGDERVRGVSGGLHFDIYCSYVLMLFNL